MLREETVILFVRRRAKPSEPFYTLEVRQGSVAQCRGKCNADMTAEVKKFIEAFKQKVLARPAVAAVC